MKFTFTLDDLELETLIRDSLREAYLDQKRYWMHDPDSKKFAKAFKRAAEYYSVPSEHKAWLESVKEL